MSADISAVHVTGPLALYVTSFSADMEAKGYRQDSVRQHLQLLGHVSRWLEAQNLDAGDLTSARVEEFLKTRRDDGYARLLTNIGIAPLLEHLRASGTTPKTVVVQSLPSDGLLAAFRSYLLEERGVAATTARDYTRVAGTFLREHVSGTDDVRLDGLTLQRVLGFLTDQAVGMSPIPSLPGCGHSCDSVFYRN